jgi:hypothetical protein
VSPSSERVHRVCCSSEGTSSSNEEEESLLSSSPSSLLSSSNASRFFDVLWTPALLPHRHTCDCSPWKPFESPNAIFSITSVNNLFYMESPGTLPMRRVRLFSEEARCLNPSSNGQRLHQHHPSQIWSSLVMSVAIIIIHPSLLSSRATDVKAACRYYDAWPL